MGKVEILDETSKNPIALVGKMAGICYGSDITNDIKNYKRGLDCIKSGHFRAVEFPDVYMRLDGYSARVIRELYTHIGGSPTRLQASTRYIDEGHFDYFIPPKILDSPGADDYYNDCMQTIRDTYWLLTEKCGISKEDAANVLPLGMYTTVACKYNARTLMTMAEQRLCTRAYHEYRAMMKDIIKALSDYSPEWLTLCQLLFKCKCDKAMYCVEKFSCGKYEKKLD